MVAANGAGLVLWMGCDIRGVRGGSSAAVTCPYRGQLMWKKCSWRLVFKASWWWQCQLTGRGGALGQQMFWLCIHSRRKSARPRIAEVQGVTCCFCPVKNGFAQADKSRL